MDIETIFEIFGYLGVTTLVIIAASKYIAKKLLDSILDKKLESHKSELSKLNSFYQIQFNSLHNERAQVIKTLYFLLIDYGYVVGEFFQGQLNKEEPVKHLESIFARWTNYLVEFNQIFHKHKIFFSKGNVDLLNRLSSKMGDLSKQVQEHYADMNIEDQISEMQNKDSDDFQALSQENQKIRLDLDIAQEKLEEQFRILLGVDLID